MSNLELFDFIKTRSELKKTLGRSFPRDQVVERIDDHVQATKWLLYVPTIPITIGIPWAILGQVGLLFNKPYSGFVFWTTWVMGSGFSYLILRANGKRQKQKLMKKYLNSEK